MQTIAAPLPLRLPRRLPRPAPSSWLWPVLLAQSAVTMIQTPRMCASGGLQHGYALLHHHLLRTAQRTHLLPPGVDAAAAAAGAERLCAVAYQPAFIVLGNAAIGYWAFCAELAQRSAFVLQCGTRAYGSQQRALWTALEQRGRLPVVATDYFLLYWLPAAVALTCLHTQMLAT